MEREMEQEEQSFFSPFLNNFPFFFFFRKNVCCRYKKEKRTHTKTF